MGVNGRQKIEENAPRKLSWQNYNVYEANLEQLSIRKLKCRY
jgi:hypothetical protein